MNRRGAALIIALALLALVGTFLAAAGARAHGMAAEQRRADRQARLRLALWDAAWSRLRAASASPGALLQPEERIAPDGVKTAVTGERAGDPKQGGPVRFALTAKASWDRDAREAWALVQHDGGKARILTWVER